jgi:hypothetical protein
MDKQYYYDMIKPSSVVFSDDHVALGSLNTIECTWKTKLPELYCIIIEDLIGSIIFDSVTYHNGPSTDTLIIMYTHRFSRLLNRIAISNQISIFDSTGPRAIINLTDYSKQHLLNTIWRLCSHMQSY